jgi:NADPH:quinone reductase-like Zn-dependent oxidoreductase
MRLIRIRKPSHLKSLAVTQEREPGRPGRGELLVRLHASSLNFHDYLVVTGFVPAADGRIPMSDGAGEVLAVGEDVTEFKVGDHVVSTFFPDWYDGAPMDNGFVSVPGDGSDGYARELVVAKTSGFTRAPIGYTHAEAATLTCAGLTAWRALIVEGNLKAGDTVLVQGTGGVSIFALQFAKAMGAQVIATSSSDAKLERLKALGADHVINYRTVPEWGETAHALTGGRGVDHVVEVGGPKTMPQSVVAARVGGHICMIGLLTGTEGTLSTMFMVSKQLSIHCMMVGTRCAQLDMVRAIERTGIHPVIDSRFPLEELGAAFHRQETGAHFGKIVVEI